MVGVSGQHAGTRVGQAQGGGAVNRSSGRLRLKQWYPGARHPVHHREAPGVSEVRPRLPARCTHERAGGVGSAVGDGGQDPSFGQRQPVPGGRVLPAEPVECFAEEPQLTRAGCGDATQAVGSRRAERRPGADG